MKKISFPKDELLTTFYGILLIIVGAALSITTLYVSDTIDEINEKKLQECVAKSESTDADCEKCFFEVYGVHPN